MIPVNPKASTILGVPALKSISETKEIIDIVTVFGPSAEADAITKDAIKVKAKAVWLQEGIISEKAEKTAKDRGLFLFQTYAYAKSIKNFAVNITLCELMKDFLLKLKIAMDRGKYWLSYIQFFMLLFVLVTSMKQYSAFSFLGSIEWLTVLAIMTLIGLVVLGYIDLKVLKTYQAESEIYARVNPVQKKMIDNQEEMLKQLKRLVNQGKR